MKTIRLKETPKRERPSRKKIRAECILFDLDGTLYDSPEYSRHFEREIVRAFSAEVRWDERQASLLLNTRRKEIGTLTRTIESFGIDRRTFYRTLADRLEPRLDISPNERTRSVVEQLKQAGFRIGLVSNSGREMAEQILSALNLNLALFDTIVTSTEAEPKPSTEPFLLALKNIRCDIHNAVYVGDREEAELRPAREMGLRTILIRKTGSRKSRWADAVIRGISGLPEVVRLG